jgi:hypothetical protein
LHNRELQTALANAARGKLMPAHKVMLRALANAATADGKTVTAQGDATDARQKCAVRMEEISVGTAQGSNTTLINAATADLWKKSDAA